MLYLIDPRGAVWQSADYTLAKAVARQRVEMARNSLETSDESLARIAIACGLSTTDTLTRAFRRQLNTTPAEYRSRFRTHE